MKITFFIGALILFFLISTLIPMLYDLFTDFELSGRISIYLDFF